MSREIKIGLLAIIAIFGSVWGYKFVKGQDLFQRSNVYRTTFKDVTALEVSSAVTINGYKVGTVESIELNPKDVSKMDVTLRIDGKIKVPKNAKLVMKSEGIVGGKYLALTFDAPCTGPDCAKDGEYLEGTTVGFLGSMVSSEEVGEYTSGITKDLTNAIKKLGADGEGGKVNEIVRQMEATMTNLNSMTKSMDLLIKSSSNNISSLTSNLNKITANLAQNNDQITQLLNNLNKTTKDLASANLSNTVTKTNSMLDNTSETVKKLQSTLEVTNTTLNQFKDLAHKIDSGAGSLGQLMNDKKLYNNLELTSKNMALLLQDLRLNPKRYVNVSVFGKKDKEYVLPENDPAFNSEKK